MLSKKVKERRRLNRLLRSEPYWHIAMYSYKMQQLTIVRLHVMHLETPQAAEGTHPNDLAMLAVKIHEKKKDIMELRRQQKEMTREEWYEELDRLNGHHHGQREWVLLLLAPDN